MYYLGIDPGLEGAFAILKDKELHAVKKIPVIKSTSSKTKIDEPALKELIQFFVSIKNTKFIMEKLSNTPGKKGTFSFGEGYGLIRGMFIYAGKEIVYVRPQDWKKNVMPGMPSDKIASCVAAARLYPEAKKYMLKPRGGLDDGIGDAICIAEWGRRNLK